MPAPQNCTAAQLISKKKNPHTATGALLEQSSFSDELSVVRASNNSRTAPEYNAGLIGEGLGCWVSLSALSLEKLALS